MKAIKVLFAVILTATLGLMTSCGGGGGGGGGGDNNNNNGTTNTGTSTDLAPTSIVGKTLKINDYDGETINITFGASTATMSVGSNSAGSLNVSYTYSRDDNYTAVITVDNVAFTQPFEECLKLVITISFGEGRSPVATLASSEGYNLGGAFMQVGSTEYGSGVRVTLY